MDPRRYKQASVEGRQEMVAPLVALLQPRFVLDWRPEAEFLPVFRDGRSGMRFLLIPPGRYQMGLSDREERAASELADPIPVNLWEMRPTRWVDVPGFLMSETPVLNELGSRVLGGRHLTGEAKRPAFVTRDEAVQIASSQQCRLAMEREWEYACRAGTATLFVFGDTLLPEPRLERWLAMDFSEPSGVQANPFGLRGMFTGEWCGDQFRVTLADDAPVIEGSYVVRGGGSFFWPWQDDEWVWCMSAMRMPSRDLLDGTCGLRLVHDLPTEEKKAPLPEHDSPS